MSDLKRGSMFGQKRALSAETFCTHFGELHALLLRQRGLAGELFRMFGELQKRLFCEARSLNLFNPLRMAVNSYCSLEPRAHEEMRYFKEIGCKEIPGLII